MNEGDKIECAISNCIKQFCKQKEECIKQREIEKGKDTKRRSDKYK